MQHTNLIDDQHICLGNNIAPRLRQVIKKIVRQAIVDANPRPCVDGAATQVRRRKPRRSSDGHILAIRPTLADELPQHMCLARPRRACQQRTLATEQNLLCKCLIHRF